jgi:hypothetical protein
VGTRDRCSLVVVVPTRSSKASAPVVTMRTVPRPDQRAVVADGP